MENPITKMYRQMFEDLGKLPQKWMIDFQQETSKWIQDLLRDSFDPAGVMEFLKGMGIDTSGSSQMFGGMVQAPPGFDPYRVLGLDRSASDDEVKYRHNELIQRLHPDKSGTPGTNFLFQMVLAAYELIKRQRGGATA